MIRKTIFISEQFKEIVVKHIMTYNKKEHIGGISTYSRALWSDIYFHVYFIIPKMLCGTMENVDSITWSNKILFLFDYPCEDIIIYYSSI